MNKIKCYLELPFLYEWARNHKVTSIPIVGGIHFSWSKYYFELCDTEAFFPRGRKEGSHIFTVSIAIFYWSASLIFYSEKS
jgi:hypothetical protein